MNSNFLTLNDDNNGGHYLRFFAAVEENANAKTESPTWHVELLLVASTQTNASGRHLSVVRCCSNINRRGIVLTNRCNCVICSDGESIATREEERVFSV